LAAAPRQIKTQVETPVLVGFELVATAVPLAEIDAHSC